MNCDEVKASLVGWHFADLAPADRDAVEAHLPGCAGCLADFLALKREVELTEAGPRPSPAARARLREAVSIELSPPGRWWEPALALSFATGSVVFAVFVLELLR